MRKYLTGTYEPGRVLRHFEDICGIPHGSGNEGALAEHICALARKRDLEVMRDSAGNVLIRKPASRGYGHVPSLLIQGHMDMVCVKSEDCERDMANEPIELVVEGAVARARGTSLGADNAVGLCNMLAFMEADDLTHPALELLFTTREEIGMLGIREFDMGLVKSRRMLTMDCGDPDCMVTSGAGNLKATISKRCRREPLRGVTYSIVIKGLTGGHSGIEIGDNRASAVELMGRALDRLAEAMPLSIVAISAGETGNSIPKAAKCVVSIGPENVERARNAIEELFASIRAEYSNAEATVRLEFHASDVAETSMICGKDTRAIADLLLLVPYGVHKRSMLNLEWKLCSSLLTTVTLDDGAFACRYVVRANPDQLKYALFDQVRRICELCDSQIEQNDAIPAWTDRPDSGLQSLCRATYKELFGVALRSEPIHGSVEAGIVSSAIPGMDAVGIAPKSRGAHTADERLFLESMQPFWLFLVGLLKNMCLAEGAKQD